MEEEEEEEEEKKVEKGYEEDLEKTAINLH
jgi:hypothetical protein